MVEEDWELSLLLQLTFVRRRYFRQFWGIVKLVDVYIKKEKIIEKMFRQNLFFVFIQDRLFNSIILIRKFTCEIFLYIFFFFLKINKLRFFL